MKTWHFLCTSHANVLFFPAGFMSKYVSVNVTSIRSSWGDPSSGQFVFQKGAAMVDGPWFIRTMSQATMMKCISILKDKDSFIWNEWVKAEKRLMMRSDQSAELQTNRNDHNTEKNVSFSYYSLKCPKEGRGCWGEKKKRTAFGFREKWMFLKGTLILEI